MRGTPWFMTHNLHIITMLTRLGWLIITPPLIRTVIGGVIIVLYCHGWRGGQGQHHLHLIFQAWGLDYGGLEIVIFHDGRLETKRVLHPLNRVSFETSRGHQVLLHLVVHVHDYVG